MPRNGAGIYTLPAGNPVITGQVVSSTWANNTLSDMGVALTQSLSADGQTAATANIPLGGNKIINLGNGTLPTDAATFSQTYNSPSEVTIASAATTNIGAATSSNIIISGTTTITAFDSVADGVIRNVVYSGAVPITYNATSMILLGGVSRTNAAGDSSTFLSLGSGNWREIKNQKATGLPTSETGLAGTFINGSMSVTSASASATFNATELFVSSSLGGPSFRIGNFSSGINLATTGVGGMDTGTAPINGFVALYAILNSSTGQRGLLAKNATSAVAPTIYNGANMPAGYNCSGLVSVWPTDGAGLLKIGVQNDRRIDTARTIVLSSASAGAFTLLSIASVVPINAKEVRGHAQASSTVASVVEIDLAASATGIGYTVISSGSSAITAVGSYSLPIITSQTMYYAATASSGTSNGFIAVSGYSI